MILEVNNLIKTINKNTILNNISFNVNKNQIVSIIGQSGAGKTTLLRALNGLTTVDSGSIQLDNQVVQSSTKNNKDLLHQKIGLVFQNFNLYPHLTVLENITLSPILNKMMTRDAANQEAKKWLSLLQLENKESQYPFQLSGGEKQRVAIARACILNPKILCFDEPTSALDPKLSTEVANVIKTLQQQDMTVLIITHDMSFAKLISDRIIVLEKGTIVNDTIANQYFDENTI